MVLVRALVPLVAIALTATSALAVSLTPDTRTAKAADTPWLGVTLKGTEVLKVANPSPAFVAGMETSDRVISVNGTETTSGREVQREVQAGQFGDFAVVRIVRGDKRLSLAVFLAPRPQISVPEPIAPPPVAPRAPAASSGVDPRFPMLGAPPTPLQPAPAPPSHVSPSPKSFSGDAPAVVADFDLAAHRGKVLVVQVMASWCGACSTTVDDLNRWHATFADQGVTVVALSSERRDTIQKHRRRAGIRAVTAHDLNGEWSRRWGVTALPTFLVFDRSGRRVETVRGAGSGVRRTEAAFTALLGPAGPSFGARRR
ncbi:MAG: thiol-disulfide isomerase/thioredoxin [Myxococcota bacterium]|jgi:thiol-disulfide isomerase/thioredoxin